MFCLEARGLARICLTLLASRYYKMAETHNLAQHASILCLFSEFSTRSKYLDLCKTITAPSDIGTPLLIYYKIEQPNLKREERKCPTIQSKSKQARKAFYIRIANHNTPFLLLLLTSLLVRTSLLVQIQCRPKPSSTLTSA